MNIADQIKTLTEDIITSYENRIDAVETLISSTHETLQNFKDERLKMSEELKNRLANNESLRKKDFDLMMKDILVSQEERSEEVKNLLARYLKEQKELAKLLRGTLSLGESIRLEKFKSTIREIQEKQKAREEVVRKTLQKFKKEQDKLRNALKEMLAKGEGLRIKDFKGMLRDIKDRQKEREMEAAQAWQELSPLWLKNGGLPSEALAKEGGDDCCKIAGRQGFEILI